MQKHILVVGGRGAIGSQVIRALQKQGCKVTATTRFTNHSTLNLNPSVKWLRFNYDCIEELEIASRKQFEFDAVINASGCKSFCGTRIYMDEQNVLPVFALRKLFDRTRIVHLSTDYIYNLSEKRNVDEFVDCRPETDYGWSKHLAELVLDPVRKNTLMVRFGHVLHAESEFLKWLVGKINRKEPFSAFTSIFSPVCMTDLVNFIVEQATTDGISGVCNFTGGWISRYSFASLFAAGFGVPVTIEQEEPKPKGPHDTWTILNSVHSHKYTCLSPELAATRLGQFMKECL